MDGSGGREAEGEADDLSAEIAAAVAVLVRAADCCVIVDRETARLFEAAREYQAR